MSKPLYIRSVRNSLLIAHCRRLSTDSWKENILQVPDFVPPIFGLRNDGRSSVIPRQVLDFVGDLESLIYSRSSKVFCVWDVAIGCLEWFTVWDPRLFFVRWYSHGLHTRGRWHCTSTDFSDCPTRSVVLSIRFHFIGCVPLQDEASNTLRAKPIDVEGRRCED